MAKSTFESNIKELEEIVSKLETGNATLDECISLFEKGAKLTDECTKMIDNAEQKIKILFENNGEIAEKNFEEKEQL